MKNLIISINAILLLLFAFSCETETERADAYGNFETGTTTVSSEANGRLLFFDVEEGMELEGGELVGMVDTTQLHLQKLQLKASIGTLGNKTQDPEPQIDVFKEQLQSLNREKKRVEDLLRDKAATPKQLDQINDQISLLNQQIDAARRQAQKANKGILGEASPLYAQIRVLDEQIRKCYIYNPVPGTVMTKIAEPTEVVGFGSPLYRIASLDTLTLRAYVAGTQLGEVNIGKKVEVYVDYSSDSLKTYEGVIKWISDKSEFTPRIVQTREERVNLVYAVKIDVPNDGFLKVGMPAEVMFAKRQLTSE